MLFILLVQVHSTHGACCTCSDAATLTNVLMNSTSKIPRANSAGRKFFFQSSWFCQIILLNFFQMHGTISQNLIHVEFFLILSF
jgi:hypothetical protein